MEDQLIEKGMNVVHRLLSEGLPVYHLLSYHICSYRKSGTVGCVLLRSHDQVYLERLMRRLMKAYWRDAPHSPMPGQVGIYYVRALEQPVRPK